MRRLLIVMLCAPLLACSGGGGGSGPTAPTTGVVYFRLDAATCGSVGTLTFNYYIDGSLVGSGNLSAGLTSPGFTVSAGAHATGAKVANTTFAWSINATVPAGGSWTSTLLCT
jgi:hypothetical protein